MGGAMAEGFLRCGGVAPSDITVASPHKEKLERFTLLGINTTTDNSEAASEADVVVVAVKPWLAQEVVKDITPQLHTGKQVLISVCAGVSSSEISQWLKQDDGDKVELFLVIPNLAISVGQSMTYVVNVNATEESQQRVKRLFEATGRVVFTDERLLRAGTSLASCGTAYALQYIKAAIQGGTALGLSEADARQAVLQTIRGSIELLETSGERPETFIRKVTTPGGMTQRGLSAMEQAGFSQAVIDGLKA